MSTSRAFWMDAKRDGDCYECEGSIETGDRIVWDPDDRAAFCAGCGVEIAGVDPRE